MFCQIRETNKEIIVVTLKENTMNTFTLAGIMTGSATRRAQSGQKQPKRLEQIV
jgi:hypothetical protein